MRRAGDTVARIGENLLALREVDVVDGSVVGPSSDFVEDFDEPPAFDGLGVVSATRSPSLMVPKNRGPKSGTILRLRRGSGGSRTSNPSLSSDRPRGADEQKGKVENQQNQIGSVYLHPPSCSKPMMLTMMRLMPSGSRSCVLNSHRRRQLTRD